MIPGEVLPGEGDVTINGGRPVLTLPVANTGDRPVQVGSHYHFAEANAALEFDRAAARGYRLAVPAGTSVRFEPGVPRDVELVPLGGRRVVAGLRALVAGPLDAAACDGPPDDRQPDGGPGGDAGGPASAGPAADRAR